MVIVMEQTATEAQIQKIIETLVEVGYDVHRSTGVTHTVLGAVGSPRQVVDPTALELLPGVREVVKISEPYKLVGRTFKPADRPRVERLDDLLDLRLGCRLLHHYDHRLVTPSSPCPRPAAPAGDSRR